MFRVVVFLFRLHQQEEGTEEEEGVVLRGAASSCHHGVLLRWALRHELNTHTERHREKVPISTCSLSDDLQPLLVSQTGTASSRVIVVA